MSTERLRESVGINFGTEYLRGTSVWIAGRRIPEDRLDAAACIYAFDALIENVDRRTGKPNLLFDGDSLWAIDHELSFAFTKTIGIQPGDWAGNRLTFLEDHPLRSDLARRQAGVSFAPFRDRLRALDDATIDAICNSCPAEFGDAVSTKIVDHLKMARARSGEFTESVLGTLT